MQALTCGDELAQRRAGLDAHNFALFILRGRVHKHHSPITTHGGRTDKGDQRQRAEEGESSHGCGGKKNVRAFRKLRSAKTDSGDVAGHVSTGPSVCVCACV